MHDVQKCLDRPDQTFSLEKIDIDFVQLGDIFDIPPGHEGYTVGDVRAARVGIGDN